MSLALLLSISNAFAQVTWTAPTKNTDGTALTDISDYNFCQGQTLPPTQCYSVGNVLSHDPQNLAPGRWYFTIRTVSASQGISDPTNPVYKDYVGTPPPVVISVATGSTETPVYGMTSTDKRSSTVLGLIKVGKTCIGPQLGTYRGDGYRRVARGDVMWWRNVTPTDNAVAMCK